MTAYRFTGAVAWDVLGTSVRIAGGVRSVSIIDPVTLAIPTGLVQGGVAVSWVTADARGRYSFECDAPSVVIDFGAGPLPLSTDEVGVLAVAADASAAASAASAAASAALVGAPAGAAIDAHMKWAPALGYTLGQQILSPNNDIAKANVAHTSSAAYATDVAKWDLSGTYVTPAAAGAAYARKDSAPVSMASFGVLPGASAATNSAGMVTAAASGATNFSFPSGSYSVTVPLGGTLMSFTNKGHVTITGDNVILNDTTTHSNNGAFSNVFLFDNCKDIAVTGVEYVGQALSSPTTLLGYQGAIFARFITGCDGIKVDAKLTNLRYGVETGDYSVPADGNCRNFDIKLRTSFCGYPIAMYRATNIRFDIDADDVHRGAYLAGCTAIKGTLRYQNNYIAPVPFLLSDALVTGTDAAAQVAPPANPTTSFGIDGVDVDVYDKGSTIFQPNTYMSGISLSRVDPVYFRNIKIRLHGAQATDTVSTQVHGFSIDSTANTYQTRYPFNWESTILLENIEVSGLIDKSATTISNGTEGVLKLRTDDPTSVTHFATVRGLRFTDFIVKPGTSYASGKVYVRGLASPLVFDGYSSPGIWLMVVGNAAQPVILNRVGMGTLDVSGVAGMPVVVGPGSAFAISGSPVQSSSTVKLVTIPSTTATAGLKLTPGVAPTTPADGDMWVTAAGVLLVRLAGVTKTVTVT